MVRGQKQPITKQCSECTKRKDFEICLCTATSETHFLFDKQRYIQHNGVAMGATLVSVIADIFIIHMKISPMDQWMEIGLCEWYRYVDDIFVLVEP
jgi:hypothetical protein